MAENKTLSKHPLELAHEILMAQIVRGDHRGNIENLEAAAEAAAKAVLKMQEVLKDSAPPQG
jgi:hypothetical protein